MAKMVPLSALDKKTISTIAEDDLIVLEDSSGKTKAIKYSQAKRTYNLNKNASNEYEYQLIGNDGSTAKVEHKKNKKLTDGLWKITADDYGHITAGTKVVKNDITALGIPAQDSTYALSKTTSNTSKITLQLHDNFSGTNTTADITKAEIQAWHQTYTNQNDTTNFKFYKFKYNNLGHIIGGTAVTNSDIMLLHDTHTAYNNNLYKITVDSYGHITAATAQATTAASTSNSSALITSGGVYSLINNGYFKNLTVDTNPAWVPSAGAFSARKTLTAWRTTNNMSGAGNNDYGSLALLAEGNTGEEMISISTDGYLYQRINQRVLDTSDIQLMGKDGSYYRIQTGSIEVMDNNPYIDFHFGQSASDYTFRLYNNSTTNLRLEASNGYVGDFNVSSGWNGKVQGYNVSDYLPKAILRKGNYSSFYNSSTTVTSMANGLYYTSGTTNRPTVYPSTTDTYGTFVILNPSADSGAAGAKLWVDDDGHMSIYSRDGNKWINVVSVDNMPSQSVTTTSSVSSGSSTPITSGGVYTALGNRTSISTYDYPSKSSTSLTTANGLWNVLYNSYQPKFAGVILTNNWGITGEEGNQNHYIFPGSSGTDYQNFLEYGATWNFGKSQNGTITWQAYIRENIGYYGLLNGQGIGYLGRMIWQIGGLTCDTGYYNSDYTWSTSGTWTWNDANGNTLPLTKIVKGVIIGLYTAAGTPVAQSYFPYGNRANGTTIDGSVTQLDNGALIGAFGTYQPTIYIPWNTSHLDYFWASVGMYDTGVYLTYNRKTGSGSMYIAQKLTCSVGFVI